LTLLFDASISISLGDAYFNQDSILLSQILMDLPTLVFMTSFSVFIYYFAKLTMQVEGQKARNTELEIEASREIFDEKRQLLLGGGGHAILNRTSF
jgi:hypothetical protein